MQPNAKVLSTSCRKTCHCRVLVRENSHKGQNGKATVFIFVRCRFPGFFSAMSNTTTWPRAVRWHESLPDHFRPCPQNTWAPYYTAARDWLKPKGVSALTDRSGVVYSTFVQQRSKRHDHHSVFFLSDRGKWEDRWVCAEGQSLCCARTGKQTHGCRADVCWQMSDKLLKNQFVYINIWWLYSFKLTIKNVYTLTVAYGFAVKRVHLS